MRLSNKLLGQDICQGTFEIVSNITETSTEMYTPFSIRFNLQYGPYAHFGY